MVMIRILRTLIVGLCIGGMSVLLGCRQKQTIGAHLDYSLSLPTYTKTAMARNASFEGRFYFPTLEAYDSQGRLVYRGRSAPDNRAFLKRASSNIRYLSSIPDTTDLRHVLLEVKDLTNSARVTDTDSITYIAIDLEDCRACAVQEQAVNEESNNIVTSGSNVISVHVQKTVIP